MSMTVYLDHNATAPLHPAAWEKMQEILRFPGNASAVHKGGRQARKRIEESRQTLLKHVNAGPRDVLVFTSGATEANNMALLGSGMERMIVSSIEHPSVLNAAPHAEKIPVTTDGIIDLSALEKMLTGNTRQTIISVMMVNNETGVIQPMAEVCSLARKYGALVHTDAVQALGRLPIDIQKLGVDFMSFSAHKIGGPQGVGCLIIANCAVIAPLLKGGNQEKNLRAGTENLAGIAGFAAAVENIDVAGYQTRIGVLRDTLEKSLKSIAPDVVFFGAGAERVANTTMFACKNMPSDMQLIGLDLAGIAASNGSACSSGTVAVSHVLKSMGVPADIASCALRVSLGYGTTAEDIEKFLKCWTDLYARAKKNHA
jgi:cysteine desulfurase